MLKGGDHLDRSQSPGVAGRGFTLTAKFDATGTNGVLAAQGGTMRGWTLFLQNAKLTFLVREQGRPTRISVAQTVTGTHTVTVSLGAGGVMRLLLDGGPAVTGKASGLLVQMPLDGLDVGSDTGAQVGPYGADNAFPGTIGSVIIDVEGEPAD